MMNRKKIYSLITLLAIGLIIFFIFSKNKQEKQYIHNEGRIFGTYYHITYQHPQQIDLQKKIEERLHEFENSLSIFNKQSIISRVNQNDTSVVTDSYFEKMFQVAQKISKETNGAFDITVSPLVNAWGFGISDTNRIQMPDVKSILPYVGYWKIHLENHKLIKDDPRIMLDASAIAKGYSADVIGQLLKENQCENYLVEIGGEIVCKGLNPKGEKWRIGIDKPIEDSTNTVNEIQTIIHISNKALATSGNYRQFYYKKERKFSHIIDPRTGFPVNNNVLSTTVIAPTCIEADAYATAFMVLGVDSALELCKKLPEIDSYLIYVDNQGKDQVIYTEGFKKYLFQ